jgi:hypothetical protein
MKFFFFMFDLTPATIAALPQEERNKRLDSVD